MPVAESTFESGAAPGATILATDVGSPTPWSSTFTDTNSTLTYDTSHPHRGRFAAKTVGTSSPCAVYLAWALAFGTDYYGRFYTYSTGWGTDPIFQVLLSSAQCCRVLVRGDLGLQIRDSADTNVGGSTALMTPSAWNRVEWHVVHSATVGLVELKMFVGANVEGLVPDETLTASNINTLTAGDQFQIGVLGNAPLTSWLDDIVAGASLYPGPARDGRVVPIGSQRPFPFKPGGR